MNATTVSALAAMLAMVLTVRVEAEPKATLTVRLYNSSGIPAPALTAARHAAESALRETGIGVNVRHCGPAVLPGGAADACQESLTPSEVVVRVINAPAFSATLHPDAYGLTYVVRETNRGWLATVFSDRIRRAAERVGVDSGTLLGLVIAHEVGHLLLGSGYHGDGGLMRADWPDALLTGAAAWKFSVGEAARMHQVLEVRPLHF